MKYFIGNITEHFGGYEFSTPVLVKAKNADVAGKKLDKAAKNWRESDEIIYEGCFSRDVSKDEFEVMSRYLYVVQ